MKTAKLYKTFLVFLLVPMLALASSTPNNKGKHTKEKTIKKEFKVNANATLKVDNSYGNIDVITWNENRVVFEIKITTNGNNEEDVQEKLNEIDVKFQASSSLVSAETVFNEDKSNSWWKWYKSNDVNMTINYIIKIPITNNVDINNDYGGINLDKLEGRANINCDYGKITTKELMADNNIINFDYTQNSYFEYIKSGEINADYSGFTIAKTKSIDIVADYTSSTIEVAENINYNCDYGSIKIKKANTIEGNGDYLTTIIGDLYKSANIEADYGSIKIENIAKNAGNINIEADYAGIKIGYDTDYNFNFDINLEYASLRDSDGLEFTKKHIESTDKYFTGYYGNSNSGNTLRITSDYGSVSLIKN